MSRWNHYNKEQPASITDLEQRLHKIEAVVEEGEMDTEDVLFLLREIEKWEESFPYDVPIKQQTPDQLKIQKIKADTQEAVATYVHRIYDFVKTSYEVHDEIQYDTIDETEEWIRQLPTNLDYDFGFPGIPEFEDLKRKFQSLNSGDFNRMKDDWDKSEWE
mgnify:FL=1